MKKTRKAHLWIGLIASIFIFMESITGLLMNEPWLIGQSKMEKRSNGTGQSGVGTNNTIMTAGKNQGSAQVQAAGQSGPLTGGKSENGTTGQISGSSGLEGMGGGNIERKSSGTVMGIIKGLHKGRIGTANVKWLIDLVAISMIFLTGSGIYLSAKVLGAGRKRKTRKNGKLVNEQGLT
ncbi:PepSY domain-containing protein [Bacillus sp. BRMEA1]|uniref:PepSY-associated TM helix domain-containing protein n=1 Tax=Neobacillus endophyticus TaxID=2738405 RepID=UPI0015647580|nr:PepSY domain-containing protein [Neobacillus endophyticus]